MRPGSKYTGPCISQHFPCNTTYGLSRGERFKGDPASVPQQLSQEVVSTGHQASHNDLTHKWVTEIYMPQEASHFLAKMLTTLKSSEPDYLMLHVMRYVSHPKIQRRFQTPCSKHFWKCFTWVNIHNHHLETISQTWSSGPMLCMAITSLNFSQLLVSNKPLF
jgi:hypothetical protein